MLGIIVTWERVFLLEHISIAIFFDRRSVNVIGIDYIHRSVDKARSLNDKKPSGVILGVLHIGFE